MRLIAIVVSLGGLACDPPKPKKGPPGPAEQTAMAAEAKVARAAAALPSSGKWDEAHLVQRLVNSGLAPQALTGLKSQAYWGAPLRSWRLGYDTLYAYIYPDSFARRRVTDGLDTLTLAPRGSKGPFGVMKVLVTQNNLAAVLVGGSVRQQERVALAIRAGLPVSP